MASRLSISSYPPPLTEHLAFVYPTDHYSAINSLFLFSPPSPLTAQEIADISESFARNLKPLPNFRFPQIHFPHPMITFAQSGSTSGVESSEMLQKDDLMLGSSSGMPQDHDIVLVKKLLKEVCPSMKLNIEFIKMNGGVITVQNGGYYPLVVLSVSPRFNISPIKSQLDLPPLRFSQSVHFFGGIPKIHALVMVDVGITNTYLHYLEINRGTGNTCILFPYIAPAARSACPVRWMPVRWMLVLVFEQEREILPDHEHSISSYSLTRRFFTIRAFRSTFSLTDFQRIYHLSLVGLMNFYYS